MKATRDGFGEQLVESGKENSNIIGLSADLGKATKIDNNTKAIKILNSIFSCIYIKKR